jgi:large subunit ribosomal protein L5
MNKKLLNYYYIRLYEKKNNVNDLLFLTKFMKFNNQIIKQNKINKILVNISFIIINFNKKRMAPFLLIIEILTSQRNFPIRSFKNILYLGIKKNNFVGCKITLRNKNLYEFLDNLILFFPQLNINSIILKKNLKQNKYNFFNI